MLRISYVCDMNGREVVGYEDYEDKMDIQRLTHDLKVLLLEY